MKGNKGGITIATFFQMARDLANVDLKEMARERGKREEESLKSLKSLKVSKSHIIDNKCNKKDNTLIYNNLDKTPNSTGDFETLRLLRLFCKDFSNGYTFSDKLDTADLPPILKKIMHNTAERNRKAAKQKCKAAEQRMQATDWLTTKHLYMNNNSRRNPLPDWG